jgi:hypothetical protein
MDHTAAVIDYTVWILSSLLTMLIALHLFRKISLLNINEGLIRVLVLLITAESVCTLIFEFLFIYGSDSGFSLFINSFMIGGEINLKGIALTLFTFRYFSASLEIPD